MELKKSMTIPVRIDVQTDEQIKGAARRMRTSAASVIRLAIATHLTAVATGSITLPKTFNQRAAR
jgi:hypothetical protein